MKLENSLKKRKVTPNEDKTVWEFEKITVFGYEIGNGKNFSG